jgi:hypothetical protein
MFSPALNENLGFAECGEDLTVKQLISELAIKALVQAKLGSAKTYPFSHGEPGVMKSVLTPMRPSQSLTAWAVNSAPLSERI